MDQGIRNFAIKVGIVVLALGVITVTYKGYNSYQEYAANKRHTEAQFYINDMIEICNFRKLSDEEQIRISACKDDYVEARKILMSITDDRIIFWDQKIEFWDQRYKDLNQIKADAGYWDQNLENKFRAAGEHVVNEWKQAKTQKEYFGNVKVKLQNWNQQEARERVHKTKQVMA